ncbi:uncharacterized protein LOC143589398 [Bidens hawaiensis]|uniref:uncharacterized protein LOC143589398 n=1 Tax=Bidens hawaiensis TaxID=980011 RepID=UPI00404AF73B
MTAPLLKEVLAHVLLVDRNRVKTLIYYVRRTPTDIETRCSTRETALNVLRKPELSSRLAKWAIELGEHAIEYKIRHPIKGQVLAYFIAKVPTAREEECRLELEPPAVLDEKNIWSLYTDGPLNDEGSGTGLRLTDPEGHEFTYTIHLEFKSTNNEAEYEAFLASLRITQKLSAQHLEAHVDSMLVLNQINRLYEAKDKKMALYLRQAKALM